MDREQEFLEIQSNLREKIVLSDSFEKSEIKTVAGVDLAYWTDGSGSERAVCCIVVLDYKTHEVIEKKQYSDVITVPYVAGFLAFRELPLVLRTAKMLENSPDLYMFDGNGYLHPRHMGIATHASIILKKPSIGVAKTYYKVKNMDYRQPENFSGAFTDIVIDGEVYGRALRTIENVKPIFVSVGSGISIETATDTVLDFVESESHIPIPTRLADLETHIARGVLTLV